MPNDQQKEQGKKSTRTLWLLLLLAIGWQIFKENQVIDLACESMTLRKFSSFAIISDPKDKNVDLDMISFCFLFTYIMLHQSNSSLIHVLDNLSRYIFLLIIFHLYWLKTYHREIQLNYFFFFIFWKRTWWVQTHNLILYHTLTSGEDAIWARAHWQQLIRFKILEY